MYVRLKPSRALNASLWRSRRRATFSMSTSTAFHARAETSSDIFMCWAMALRMCETGTTSSPPVTVAGAGGAAGGGAGAPAAGPPPGATKLRPSSFVTPPPVPEPETWDRSTPCSAASLRTSGDRICDLGPRSGSGSAFAGTVACEEARSRAAGTVGSGAGASAVGGDTEASASPEISARSVPTETVSPSGTRIFVSVPAAGEGTSVSTLSVEISNSGSSTATSSPSCFSHFKIVPSTTVSPSCGILTWVIDPPSSPRGQLPDGVLDVGDLGQVRVLEHRGERHWNVGRSDADDRRVERLEPLLRDDGGDLGADAQEAVALVQHDRAARPRDGPPDRLGVERDDRAQVHDLDAHPLLREVLGGFERLVHHHAVGDHGYVGPLALDIRRADRDQEVGVLGDDLLDAAVDPLVLEEHARIVVADRRLQQTLRVGRERRAHHLQPRCVCEPRLGVERVEARGAHPAAGGSSQHHRRRHAAPVVVAGQRGGGLVESARHEVGGLGLGERGEGRQ